MNNYETGLWDFALEFAQEIGDHDSWIAFVKFGSQNLMIHQELLLELIVKEAEKLKEYDRQDGGVHTDLFEYMDRIMEELNLKFTYGNYKGITNDSYETADGRPF